MNKDAMGTNNKTNKLFLMLSVVILIMTLGGVGLCVYFSHKSLTREYIENNCYMLDEGWYRVMPDGQHIPVDFPIALDVRNGEEVVLEVQLPEELPSDAIFCFVTSKSTEVFVDGKFRRKYDSSDNTIPGGNVKGIIFEVRLDKNDAGKTLRMVRREPNVKNGNMSYALIGNSYGIFSYFFKLFGVRFTAAIILFALSLITAGVGVYIGRKYDGGPDLIVLSAGVMLVSVWSICDSHLFQYFFNTDYIDGVMGFMFAMVMPYPFMYYLDRMQHHRYQKIFNVLSVATIFNFIFFTTLHFTGTVNFGNSLIFMNGVVLLNILIMVITLLIDRRKGYYKEYMYLYIGMLGMAIFGFFEVLQINFKIFGRTNIDGVFIIAGQYFLLITALIRIIMQVRDLRDERAKVIKSNELKSTFLANMSHEIRTPVNAIMGMNEMILRENADEDIRRYAHNIQSASNNLLEIINDILDFSKIESGKMEIVNQQYELFSLINDVTTMISVKASQKGLSFDVEVDSMLPSELIGDEQKVRQIMINILNNAVKYTTNGGIKFRVYGDNAGDTFKLCFDSIDSGTGIKQEDFDKMFEKFQRINEEANASVEGSGLGLSITKQYVDAMNGNIAVASTFGEGSTFSVSIPQQVASDEPVGDIEEKVKLAIEMTDDLDLSFVAPEASLLVVDDNLMNLEVARGIIKPTQIRVDICTSGAEALESLVSKKYDLVFLDHMMPGMDGVETLKRFKQIENCVNESTPIIALTANAIKGAKEIYLSEGFDGYLSKPIMIDQLDDLLRGFLPSEKVKSVQKMDLAFVKDKKSDTDVLSSKRAKSTLPEIVDMDFEYARHMFPDDEQLINAVKVFLRNIPDEIAYYEDIMQTDLNEVILNEYRIRVHSLKSTSKLIGALAMFGLSRSLEEAAKQEDKDAVMAGTPILIKELKRHQALISEEIHLDEVQQVVMSDEEYKSLLNKLKGFVDERLFDEMDETALKLSSVLLEQEEALMRDKLCQAIYDLDFDLVDEILAKLL